MHHKQGALDMKSYVPTPLPHGHQGALSQTQPGHAVHPTSTPLFWVSAVHPALYDWMALPTNRIGLKKNKIKKHHPWWLGNQSLWKPYPQNIILELVRDHSGQLFLGRALENSGSSRLYISLLKLKSELWWKLQGKQFVPNMLWDITWVVQPPLLNRKGGLAKKRDFVKSWKYLMLGSKSQPWAASAAQSPPNISLHSVSVFRPGSPKVCIFSCILKPYVS